MVLSASTGPGWKSSQQTEGASLIAFGSDYRTPPGHAEPPNSAQQLLEIGATAVAVAAAGLRADPPGQSSHDRRAARGRATTRSEQTASALARLLGRPPLSKPARVADLIVVGSPPRGARRAARPQRHARAMLDTSRGSVLVVPAGKPVLLQAV